MRKKRRALAERRKRRKKTGRERNVPFAIAFYCRLYVCLFSLYGGQHTQRKKKSKNKKRIEICCMSMHSYSIPFDLPNVIILITTPKVEPIHWRKLERQSD
jgi:hypothetical protein